jgi:hypothetical protein
MTATTKVPLGAATLVRKWALDWNSGSHAAPVWVGVFGITDFKAVKDPSLEDDSDFDSAGWKSSTVSALGWSIELTVQRKVTAAAATAYDPGQEGLRAASDFMGTGNTVEVRWYELTTGGPKVEAYQGYATVSWEPSGGAMDALDTVDVKLTGKGARTAITHPDGTAVVPVVSSITPATGLQAGGSVHIIRGSGFMLNGVDNVVATSGVKFGVTNATRWVTVSDNEIAAVMPAKAAGPFIIYVTNAVGVSIGTAAVIDVT